MQGIGNDYIYVNCFEETVENPSEKSKLLSNRNFGIGSDGLVLIMESKIADFRMRMFNSDGSESEMCGNAIRCIGKYVYDKKMADKKVVTIETLAGIKVLELNIENGKVSTVRVDMGEPILKPSKIPIDSGKEKFISESVNIDGKDYEFTGVSMGNPHVITYLDDIDNLKIEDVGPKIELFELFPNKTNAEFAKVIDRKTVKMRVWERGAGETLACGTGACAVMVSSVLNNLIDREATIKLLGGDLKIEWNKDDNHVYMTGPAVIVFEGELL
jgi:diaminopimelate epimerase